MSLAISAPGSRQASITIDAYAVRLDVGVRPGFVISGLTAWPSDALHGPSLELEAGGFLLLESGDRLLLE